MEDEQTTEELVERAGEVGKDMAAAIASRAVNAIAGLPASTSEQRAAIARLAARRIEESVEAGDTDPREVGERRYTWTQASCWGCWESRRGPVGREKTEDGPPETCSYCGRETRSGIYVRDDPEAVAHPRYETA